MGGRSKVRTCRRRASVSSGEMGAPGRVLLWLQLCGRPGSADPQVVSLGPRGRDLRTGREREAALVACLDFPVLWHGLVRSPVPRRWRNPSPVPVDSKPLAAPLCAEGTGPWLPDPGTPLYAQGASRQSSFLSFCVLFPSIPGCPRRVNRDFVPWEGTFARALQIR